MYNTILYAEINSKLDHCDECDYDGEIQIVEKDGKLIWQCPNCGCTDPDKMHIARRTCGYIGLQGWNQGRTQEIKDRFVHMSISKNKVNRMNRIKAQMRDATKEEQESVNGYISSISKPTGVNFYDELNK